MSDKEILVCQGTGCVSAGAEEIHKALEKEIVRLNQEKNLKVKRTGCHGFCQRGPLVVIEPDGIFYSHVRTDDAGDIISSLLPGGNLVERLLYLDPQSKKQIIHYQDITFYNKQQRTILKNCGHIDPENINDYGGYKALRKVLQEMTPEQVIDEVKHSGLRGLGGAGFPTGRKWEACRKAVSGERLAVSENRKPKTENLAYVICNADEGGPGAFQGRSVLEGDPNSVLEGMIIAGYAIGAKKGYIYVRAEYPLAVKRLQIAIFQAREKGFLGKNILDKNFDFDIEIFQGASAFVCGESTALVRSIEGKRGMPKAMPRLRTTEEGLWNKPTLLNNVKTFANIPLIITNGAEWFAQRGTDKSKGTAVFSLTGKVVNCGLIEVPMGITLREIIFEIGGGIPEGKKFKAVQTGGPSGGCLPSELLDTPIDFDSLIAAGSIMGSGGIVVMDENTCMVDAARCSLDFIQKESCGQCIPCRLGTKQMLYILEEITQGRGRISDIETLYKTAEGVQLGSLCALGKTAPNPVLTTLKYFKDEYTAHIEDKKCPAKVCKALIYYRVCDDKCKACMLCLKACPVEAIEGGKKEIHKIIQEKCIKCGICLSVCPKKFSAIECVAGKI